MSFAQVKEYFTKAGLADKVIELTQSSATVAEAAAALGCEPKQIAKTLSFAVDGKPVLIVAAGDAKVDNHKFKTIFHQKASMIPSDKVEEMTGHAPGGVCPFVVKPEVKIFLDESLKRFERVYPAAGSGHSAVDLSLTELQQYAQGSTWIDVCKGWQQQA